MRFLSLSQPWLWSIDTYAPPPGSDVEAKRVENRSWPCPSPVTGERIALHAAKSWDGDAISMFLDYGMTYPASRTMYRAGVISSVATVLYCSQQRERFAIGQRRWFFGPWGWALTDVRRLADPIPWKGAQGLRHLPAEITAEIESQLARAA